MSPGEDDIASACTGMSPRAILTSAFYGIQFWAGSAGERGGRLSTLFIIFSLPLNSQLYK